MYRSGVAAYLAAHGLVGRGVEAAGYPEGGPASATLSFETGDAVDDIRCGLADGTTLWLQAKRACGADAQLRATAAQWVGQAGSLRDGDKVGLVTAEPRGPVRDLGAALDRRRRSPKVAGPFPPGASRISHQDPRGAQNRSLCYLGAVRMAKMPIGGLKLGDSGPQVRR